MGYAMEPGLIPAYRQLLRQCLCQALPVLKELLNDYNIQCGITCRRSKRRSTAI